MITIKYHSRAITNKKIRRRNMGCCMSSPYSKRVYRAPGDPEEEENVPLKYFGQFRNNSVVIPDDIDGVLASPYLENHLPSRTYPILYQAELDQGQSWRCIRPFLVTVICYPILLPFIVLTNAIKNLLFSQGCSCDEVCCWVRKEYSTRSFYRVYSNRIEYNVSAARIPFGYFGCGSWNADAVLTNVFDRGAFGFRRVSGGVFSYLCCCWPLYGGTVARQRCPCNGPLWDGGWWCDEWPCDMCFCTYRYPGMADAEEVAFASSIALQAYFEGRNITKEDMDKCVAYWRENISEENDPEGRKRDVCCEPYYVPFPTCEWLYEHCHSKREVPYGDDDERNTPRLREAYEQYEELRVKQIDRYKQFRGPVQVSTVCKMCGCRRCHGRRGCCFCTEGCSKKSKEMRKNRKKGDPFPPFEHRDWDDDNDASKILMKVLGDPPKDVVYTRWDYDEEKGENVLVTYPKTETSESGSSKAHDC